METFTAQEYTRRVENLDGWDMRITSYRLRDLYVAKVDNVSPGAKIARAEASSRDEAEELAIAEARSRLATTRRIQ